LEYAFHLLGDVRGKRVLDLGCGSGENTVPLLMRGAEVIAIDISPEMIAAAGKRLATAGLHAVLQVGSAYDTGLEAESFDMVFCVSLLHHLDIAAARQEIQRVLAPGGHLIVKEPVRYSRSYARARSLLPRHQDISKYEHPLTPSEMDSIREGFEVEDLRYFRLPFIPLVQRIWGEPPYAVWAASDWMMRQARSLERFATLVVAKLQKPDQAPRLVPQFTVK
jgi:SAM-dependent methyltransferase